MTWYFEPPADHGQDGQDGDSSSGLAGLPGNVLRRHGARVLSPPDAAAVHGWPAPLSTVYRARTLLVPAGLLGQAGVNALNQVLARVGMSLTPLGDDEERHRDDPGEIDGPGERDPGLAQRVVVLRPAAGDGEPAAPVVVDAWVALQMLRGASASDPELSENAVRRIGLEHLLVGSSITGTPITEGGGVTGSPITEGGGVTGPGATDSYLYSGGDARTPVGMCAEAPPRRGREECAARYGRRPVVAVLDTGARVHPWLGVGADKTAPGGYRVGPDAFTAIDMAVQDALYAHGEQAATAGDRPRALIKYPWDTPVTADPLVGELDTHTGHGTFIAGVVRQAAPDAEVLAIRIMHSDGIVYESDLMRALRMIARRVAHALAGDMAKMVDVVSLSLGYFSEAASAADAAYSSGLLQVISELNAMGVPVVAAAGNYATSRRFYPAAFAAGPAAAGSAPVISVGALNPDGSKAAFSDGGHWVRAWAPGAALVSTFPTDINGSREPEFAVRSRPAGTLPASHGLPGRQEALDPDDYSGGFAVWSGTSFAAPLIGAQIAGSLAEGAANDPSLRLDQPGGNPAADRIASALLRLGWQG